MMELFNMSFGSALFLSVIVLSLMSLVRRILDLVVCFMNRAAHGVALMFKSKLAVQTTRDRDHLKRRPS